MMELLCQHTNERKFLLILKRTWQEELGTVTFRIR
jgi:hypothetical protein